MGDCHSCLLWPAHPTLPDASRQCQKVLGGTSRQVVPSAASSRVPNSTSGCAPLRRYSVSPGSSTGRPCHATPQQTLPTVQSATARRTGKQLST